MLKKQTKDNIVLKFARFQGDTGSSEVQVAILSQRIREVAEHLKQFPKDFHSRQGLLKLVTTRRSFLGYLKRTDMPVHDKLLASLKSEGLM
jgi:small subunit ribosomal protein S15